MGEFSPPFFEPPSFFFFSYPSNIDSNIEIIFDFSDFHPHFTPHFKILDPRLYYAENVRSYSVFPPLELVHHQSSCF